MAIDFQAAEQNSPLEVFSNSAQARFQEATKEYQKYLLSDKFLEVRNYVRSRGLTDKEIEAAQIGFCPPYHQHWWYGLRGRVVLPVKDSYGRTLGFAGRKFEPMTEMTIRALRSIGGEPTKIQERIDKWSAAKWLNESFPKKRHLYGMDLAKEPMRERGYGVLVEGYMDRLVSAAVGIPNTLGVCGVTVSSIHAQIFRRYADRAVFLLDPDAAGANGVAEGIKVFEEAGIQTLVVNLPAPYDPDEYLLNFSVSQLKEIFEDSLNNQYGSYTITL